MKNRLILSFVLCILCLFMAVQRGVSAPAAGSIATVASKEPGDKGKLHRPVNLISSEALIARIANNTSPVYYNRLPDWGKRSCFHGIDPRLFLLSQFGLCSLEEICSSTEASAPPLYLVNRVFLI